VTDTVDLRPTLLALYVTVSAWATWRFGLTTERLVVVPWVLLGAAIWAPQRALRVAPVVGVLLATFVAYDLTRGAADTLGMPIHTRLPIVADETLFGTVPTVWLQDRLLRNDTQWWEVVVGLTYLSHFFVPYLVGIWLWITRPAAGRRWLAIFAAVTVAGLVTYVLVPTVPPWLAARQGDLDAVDRRAVSGLALLDLRALGRLVDFGRRTVNPVAALPSLHAAYALITAVVLWPWRAGRALLVAFPVLMGLSLVWSGEHYVFDVLVGWVYVAASVWAVDRWSRRRAA
jgi:membrane-associated phospholipid phosphatase